MIKLNEWGSDKKDLRRGWHMNAQSVQRVINWYLLTVEANLSSDTPIMLKFKRNDEGFLDELIRWMKGRGCGWLAGFWPLFAIVYRIFPLNFAFTIHFPLTPSIIGSNAPSSTLSHAFLLFLFLIVSLALCICLCVIDLFLVCLQTASNFN